MSEQNEQKNYADYLPNYYSEPDPYEFRVGFGRRLAAYIIDSLIISLLLVIALFASGQMNELIDGIKYFGQSFDDEMIQKVALSIVPVVAVVNLLYYSSELFFGASLGKMMLGIRIGDDERKPAPLTRLLTRYLIKNISVVLSLVGIIFSTLIFDFFGDFLQIIIYIGFFFTLSARRQSFHDMLSATAVYYSNEIIENNNQ
jgi:uncharacterized RDD family membrane protein YckC